MRCSKDDDFAIAEVDDVLLGSFAIHPVRAHECFTGLRLPEHRDLSKVFPWWLWLANLNQHKPGIIGAGIVSAQLAHAIHNDSVVLFFTRVDACVCFVILRRNGRGKIKVTQDS